MMISEKLIEAKAIVERGWTKNKYVTPAGRRHCTMGAIHRACGAEIITEHDCQYPLGYMFSHERHDLIALFTGAMREVLGWDSPDYMSIPSMNDHPDTSKEIVIASFEKAIAKAQELGQ